MTTAAMANRTVRKSADGTCSTRSRMRKKVEPHTAVTDSRSSVARRPAGTRESTSDDDELDGAALGLLGARPRVLAADGAEDAAHEALDRHREPGVLEDLGGLGLLLALDVRDGHQHRALGDDQLDLVALEQAAAGGGLGDDVALGHGVAVGLLGGVDLEAGLGEGV